MRKYLKEEKKILALSLLFSLIASVVAIRIQFFKGEMLDFAISKEFKSTINIGLILLFLIGVEIASQYFFNYFRGKYSVNIAKKLRYDFFNSIFNKSTVQLEKEKKGDFVAKYTNQIDLVHGQYYGTIPLLIEIILKILLVTISLFILDYRIAILTIFLLTMPLYLPKLVEKKLQKAQMENINAYEDKLGKVIEWIDGMDIIKSFSVSRVIRNKFNDLNVQAGNKNFIMKKKTYYLKVITTLLSYMSHFVIMFVAAIFVVRGIFTPGEFFISISMIDQLSYPLITLSVFIQEIISAKPVKDQLEKAMAYQPSHQGYTKIDQPIHQVKYDDVSFAYDSKEIISKFSLAINRNEKCLIMGPSGSGKTTLINLMLGHYQPIHGRVIINEHTARDLINIQENVAIMKQDPFLFNESLRDNITMYADISDDKIMEVLEKLGMDKFCNKDALDGIIQENGSNLSGGERKRIALARTLLRDSPIIVLDEPHANVDQETLSKIEAVIDAIENKILIVISHHFDPSKEHSFDHIINLETR